MAEAEKCLVVLKAARNVVTGLNSHCDMKVLATGE
jgi:hypothetical protein